MDVSADDIPVQPLYHKADTVSPMHILCFLSVCVFHCHLIPLQKNVSHMYHHSQDKKQNDQHGYESQNCHGLQLIRKYIFSFRHNKTLSMLPICFSHASRKAITASFPEHHSAYSYPAVLRYVHSCLYFWPVVHLLQKHWQSWQQSAVFPVHPEGS